MMLAPPSGVGGSLARRLSHLGRKPSSSQSNSDSTLKSDLPQYRNGNDSLLRRGSRTESVSSIETTSSNGFGPQNGTGNHAPESTLEDVPEAEISDAATEKGHSPGGSSRKAKGKGRAVEGEGLDDSWNSPTDGNTSPARRKNDPFRDPGSNSSSKRNSNGGDIYSNSNSYHTPIKPTATRPIVTVGRAPSIASRQRSSNNPSIVQTDHDADSILSTLTKTAMLPKLPPLEKESQVETKGKTRSFWKETKTKNPKLKLLTWNCRRLEVGAALSPADLLPLNQDRSPQWHHQGRVLQVLGSTS